MSSLSFSRLAIVVGATLVVKLVSAAFPSPSHSSGATHGEFMKALTSDSTLNNLAANLSGDVPLEWGVSAASFDKQRFSRQFTGCMKSAVNDKFARHDPELGETLADRNDAIRITNDLAQGCLSKLRSSFL